MKDEDYDLLDNISGAFDLRKCNEILLKIFDLFHENRITRAELAFLSSQVQLFHTREMIER